MWVEAGHALNVRHGANRHSGKQNNWRLHPTQCQPSKPIRASESGRIYGTTERLFETQRMAAVVIILVVPAKQPIPRLLVTRNGSFVVLVHFEPQCLPAVPLGSRLRGRHEFWPDAATADMGRARDGIKACRL